MKNWDNQIQRQNFLLIMASEIEIHKAEKYFALHTEP